MEPKAQKLTKKLQKVQTSSLTDETNFEKVLMQLSFNTSESELDYYPQKVKRKRYL